MSRDPLLICFLDASMRLLEGALNVRATDLSKISVSRIISFVWCGAVINIIFQI